MESHIRKTLFSENQFNRLFYQRGMMWEFVVLVLCRKYFSSQDVDYAFISEICGFADNGILVNRNAHKTIKFSIFANSPNNK